MKIIFATNNQHKVAEIRSVLTSPLEIVSLCEAGIDIDIPEPHDTLEKNAEEKATVIYQLAGTDCFSEDTGLEVNALGGEPGVLSARYAGEQGASQKNIEKLLKNLNGAADRSAQFRTVICLIYKGGINFFEGTCRGRITTTPQGSEGFGYDPVFIPEGADSTFAMMGREEKNRYSHRSKAVYKLVTFLNQ